MINLLSNGRGSWGPDEPEKGTGSADRRPEDMVGAHELMRLELGDIEVAWRASGSGDPVVLVHGLAEDSRSWDAQLGRLGEYRTFAYDLRGHGKTTLGSADGTLAQLGDDLAHFLAEVTGPAICVGFSLGGAVVLWAAAHRPELVRRAVVLATSSVVGRRARDFYADRIDLVRANRRDEFALALREDTAAALARPDVDVDAVTARRLEAIGRGDGYVNGAVAMVALNSHPLTSDLQNVGCEVTVVGGERDTFCPRRAADVMLEVLPRARYVEIDRVGHLMNVDDPDAVTAAIVEACA